MSCAVWVRDGVRNQGQAPTALDLVHEEIADAADEAAIVIVLEVVFSTGGTGRGASRGTVKLAEQVCARARFSGGCLRDSHAQSPT